MLKYQKKDKLVLLMISSVIVKRVSLYQTVDIVQLSQKDR